MKSQNSLAKRIDTAGSIASYDEACKQLLANKVILAWILKYSTKEFADYDIYEIAEKYIEGEPEISKEAVHRDESYDISKGTINIDEMSGFIEDLSDEDALPEFIEGLNAEDASIKEGIVKYYIKFRVIIPDTDNVTDMIVNIEAQNDFYPGYPIIKRGIYYSSRMISSQYETVFTESHYEKLKKVSSIWICTKPPKYRRNTIARYDFKKKDIYGHFEENEKDYDLISVVVVCLNGNSVNTEGDDGESGEGMEYDKLIKMLSTLLSKSINSNDKKKILSEEFKINMTKEMEGSVSDMCNLGQGIYDDGYNEGYGSGHDESIVNNINNLMKNTGWDIEKCMVALGIDEEEKEKYKEIIMNDTINV